MKLGQVNSLPMAPNALCFNKDEFMKDGFSVDEFVSTCRKQVQLEQLRDDLGIYLKVLRSAMIELINKDYADFVNLSTNLVGLDKAIKNLSIPLENVKAQVMEAHSSVTDCINLIEEKLKKRAEIRQKKACLLDLMSIIESVEKIERLLNIPADGSKIDLEAQAGPLDGQLIERVATEFNQLQYHVMKSKGHTLVEKVKPKIMLITSVLQYSLEQQFAEGLEKGNFNTLKQCLRTYATIDKIRDVENLFRQNFVRPYMESIITEDNVGSLGIGLEATFQKVLDFIPLHCEKLLLVSSITKSTDVVQGYDFLVNSVWPEVVICLESRTPSIFAPGDPDVFHEKYCNSMKFLEEFESKCETQSSVRNLRAHPSYGTFMNKWSLPVYFQIRFQEIASPFENALGTPFDHSKGDPTFHLTATVELWCALCQCWDASIYLPSLCHRFWQLTLQLLTRYNTSLNELQELHSNKSSQAGASAEIRTASPSPMGHERPQNTVTLNIGNYALLIADTEKLLQKIPGLFEEKVKPKLEELNFENASVLEAGLEETVEDLRMKLEVFAGFIVDEISTECASHLRHISDIPRLYRRTNRDVPSKPSSYVRSVMKPLSSFLQQQQDIIDAEQQKDWAVKVIQRLCELFASSMSDVLTSVKKMEDSLKRLKKARGGAASTGKEGLSDDDKIRLQIAIDVQQFGSEFEGLGVYKVDVDSYEGLVQLVESARSTSS